MIPVDAPVGDVSALYSNSAGLSQLHAKVTTLVACKLVPALAPPDAAPAPAPTQRDPTGAPIGAFFTVLARVFGNAVGFVRAVC